MQLTTEQWAAVRKIIYGLIALAGIALTAFGIVNAEQWASISAGLTGIVGAILALANVSPTQYTGDTPASTEDMSVYSTEDYASSDDTSTGSPA